VIIATAEFRINEGKEAEAVAAIKKVVAAVNADEPGALTYAWHRDIKDAARILVYEVWADEEATKLHRDTKHMAEFNKEFGRTRGVFDPESVKITRFERVAAIDR
jgi:quinol monooxygenase YgiN